MQDFGYKILRFVLGLFARLPFAVLYIFADFLYIIIYYIVGYRRKLVDRNLALCFPDKSDKERRNIARQFYHNFADYIVESIKLLHISDEEMARRFSFGNMELIDQLVASGKSIVIYFSHCGNWEWAPSMTLHTARRPGDGVEYCQVYRPLRNKAFDRLMLDIRGRFGSLSFPKASVLRDLLRLRKSGKVSVTGFMSDQKPSHGDEGIIAMFLNRPTAFIHGTELLARRLDMAAIYWDVEKPSRGHYHITCRLVADDPTSLIDGDLTRRYIALLQDTILRNPSIWLWTHNRWKHPVEMPQE